MTTVTATFEGTTAFTCQMVEPKVGTAGFSKEHCKAVDAVSTEATFEHFSIEQGLKTETTITNEKTANETKEASVFRLKSTQTGIEFELSANKVHGTGTLTNVLAGKEHIIENTGTLVFEEVKVTKPANKGCEVWTDNTTTEAMENVGTVDTMELKSTSAGQGDAIKFQPVGADNVFAAFWITNCSIAELNGTYTVTGSITTTSIDGATFNFTHANTTTQNTLKARSAKAGIDGSLTIKGRKVGGTEETTPLSPTTVSTE